MGQSVFNTHFLELLDQYESKTNNLNKELEVTQKHFKIRVDKDLEIYRKYISTLHLLQNISNTLGAMDITKIPTQFIIIKDLVFRENNIRDLLDHLSKEIIELEDEQSGIDHQSLRRYSVNAGIHTIAVPNIIVTESPVSLPTWAGV